MKTTKNAKITEQKILDPAMIKEARRYLESRVGITGAHSSLFLYMLENAQYESFVKLLKAGKTETADPKSIITAYLKKVAELTDKINVTADICNIKDDENRESFREDTLARRERFEPIDKTKIEDLKKYLKKVIEGLSIDKAIKALSLNPDMLNYTVVRSSEYWED